MSTEYTFFKTNWNTPKTCAFHCIYTHIYIYIFKLKQQIKILNGKKQKKKSSVFGLELKALKLFFKIMYFLNMFHERDLKQWHPVSMRAPNAQILVSTYHLPPKRLGSLETWLILPHR